MLGPTAANGKLLDGALKGATRLQVIRRLMEFDRFPKILKDVRDKAFAAGQKDTSGKRALGAMPGVGGSPSLETDTRSEEVKGDAKAEEAFGAKSGQMRL